MTPTGRAGGHSPLRAVPQLAFGGVASSWITDSVGRVLSERYYLGRAIGTGASAHVFVAEDKVLGRRVAVKVLRPGLAGDVVFLRRFQAEARVVAALEHRHILRIYDWGEDDGDPYLVSELLEGGSLRSLLDQGGRLTPAQAASVGYEAASALDHAHQHGLVHRDVKPANLLFDGDGRVTVADFGLARALAEAAWTEPAGAILGTARYAAPEQIQGQSLGPRADVYALALVLTEATTGVVPFGVDTTFGTLMARVGRSIEVGEAAGPLAEVLRAAGAPEPEDRPDAAELAAALRRLIPRLPAPDPLPLVPLSHSEVRGPDPDPTSVGVPGHPRVPAVEGGAAGPTAGRSAPPGPPAPSAPLLLVAPPPPGVAPADPGPAGRSGGGAELSAPVASGVARSSAAVAVDTTSHPGELAERSVQPGAGSAPGSSAARAPGAGGAGHRRGWVAAGVLAAVLVVAGGGAGAWALTRQPPLEAVPAVRYDSLGAARSALVARHLRLVVAGRTYNAAVPAGEVVSQTPGGGRLRRDAAVAVVVSRGPQPVVIPPVAGLTEAQAGKLLAADGLRVGKVDQASSLAVAAGSVIATEPAAGREPPGARVGLIVSSGKPEVAVPLLHWPADSSWKAASAALTAAHLHPLERPVYNNVVPAGEVVYTSPAPGARVRWGSDVAVEVSEGPHLVTLPGSITGQGVAAATAELQSLGLAVSGVTGNPAAAVTGTDPPIGTAVRVGSAVQLVTG